MQTLAEKRVYGDRSGATTAFVAAETGLVAASVSGTNVGEFSMPYRGPVRDVLATARGPVIATPDGVYRSTSADDRSIDAGDVSTTAGDGTGGPRSSAAFERIGAAPAVAIGLAGGHLLVGREDGTLLGVARDRWPTATDPEARSIGTLPEIRSIDGRLVATPAGVYRVDPGAIQTDDRPGSNRVESDRGSTGAEADPKPTNVGLEAVNDVFGHGMPVAATDDGLYVLGNGWMDVLEGRFDLVAGDGHGGTHTAGEPGFFEQTDDGWSERSPPIDGSIAALAHGDGRLAVVTDDGGLCVTDGDDWGHQYIGVSDVRAAAIGPAEG